MDVQPDIPEKASQLMQKAWKAKQQENLQEARNFANEAVALSEEANVDSSQLKIQRELLFVDPTTKDYSGPLSVAQEIEAANQGQQISEHIDLLLDLTGLLILSEDKKEALRYLNKVEKLMSSIQPNQIAEHMPKYGSISNETFLALRRNTIEQYKQWFGHF